MPRSSHHDARLFQDEYRCWQCSIIGDLEWALEHTAGNQYSVNDDGHPAIPRGDTYRARQSKKMSFDGYVRAVVEGRHRPPPGSFISDDDRAWAGDKPPVVRVRNRQLEMEDKVARSYRHSYNVYLRELGKSRDA